ncbi:MAG: helix-turn-helix transcriptional regulator [Deltaproteobacteria bacterium]|nr:helix-turn-helix transcriptional regulator [Deltaproteobacteria bacterium]MBW2015493.1 helix-turn-helix transcriptional regulator [Deltaproteobacteria bacterium]MBW2128759.1 helix-turn-helix transcriptional regulator [Deltaproteobacteria bacterium]MBW2303913.1 helix-turn-helix transcriptional regulator [Deltaproteobacteria bacterium]
MEGLGSKIREERKALGLTLEQFAELLGTSTSMLQRVETGVRSPSVDLLVEIANVCRKPIDEFLNNKPIGFRKFDPSNQKTIHISGCDITILCPYGLISKDIVVSHFRGKKGAEIEPQRHDGYCWVYILKGSCTFEHDGVQHELKKGDSIFYDAAKPQHLKVKSTLESIRITIRR